MREAPVLVLWVLAEFLDTQTGDNIFVTHRLEVVKPRVNLLDLPHICILN